MAAKWQGTPWPLWLPLDGYEKARVIAAYRTQNRIEAVAEKEAKREAALNRRLKGSRKGR